MFTNEVLIDKSDKNRIITLLEEVNSILKKYPYQIYDGSHTVTIMCRTKTEVESALTWCQLLYVDSKQKAEESE